MQEADRSEAASGSSERLLGLVLVGLSALVFGMAGVLTKSIHADPFTILCWRGLVGFVLVGLYVRWRGRAGPSRVSKLGREGWLLVAVGALASIVFIASFKHAPVANVTIIYATVPLAAALLGWAILGEKVRGRTFGAAVASLAGVGVMVAAGLGSGHQFGNGLAITMTLLSALYLVLIRLYRNVPAVWAGAVSALLLFFLGWLVTDPLAVTLRDSLLLVAFGISFAVAVVLWTEGARLLPAAESALLGLAEVPCGILLAWLALGEVPPAATAIGGVIVLGAVVWHAAGDWRDSRSFTPG